MTSKYHQIDLEQLVKDGSKVTLRCPFPKCNTRVIPLGKSLYENFQVVKNSPDMVETDEARINQDTKNFFKVNDVWDFDNIGVSKPSDDLKNPEIDTKFFKIERLLVCSECDRGPLGFAGHETEQKDVNQLKYFLSCSSVVYDIE